MRIYIAGKITGLDTESVNEKFNTAKLIIKSLGYEPVSPLDNGCASECWCEQMMSCLPMLMSCDGVYFLSDWKDSDGAKIERTFALKSGKLIIDNKY